MQSDNVQTLQTAQGGSIAAQQNRVLRNTYMLLAISLVPTVAGAALGMALKLPFLTGWMGLIVFLVGAFGFMFAIEKNKNNGLGVALLLGFTFFMGLMLSNLLNRIMSFGNGGQLIALAFGGTSIIFFGMATLASTIKKDLSGMGKFLFVGALIIFVAAIANVFLQIPALMLTISVLAIGIFSAFMLYDINRIITGGETNYISATLAIYLDIYNVFSNLLALLGIFGGDD
ncbi:MAG: Bax inhibitor-1/YccA family protein [Burkholderiales bacterium]|nr:Bax inhibitor-1/YccA family protein [Burkholderiales bacterium]